ncbi:6-carboxytetrahydropterin synthase QueD [Patescibacteria group bacterium]|nr:6-carboxytetrahydropterin synthase QueD [Patescibacteria group bacterium]
MFVTKEFTFDAAHYLTKYNGKCEKLHGHTYKLHVTVAGELDNEDMVIDFVHLKEFVKTRVTSKLDHSSLNDFFENPSAELMVIWIWDQLKDVDSIKNGVRLHEVKLWETATSFVTYNGE